MAGAIFHSKSAIAMFLDAEDSASLIQIPTSYRFPVAFVVSLSGIATV